MTEEAAIQEGVTVAARPRRRTWVVVLVWVLVLGFLALLGAGLLRTQQGPIAIGSRAPQFTLKSFDGPSFNTADLAGKVVLVNFWASWCKPCEQEAAALESAYQQHKDQGVVFLGVDYVDTEPEARAYLARFGITYPNGPDLGTRISQAFRIRGVPETYVIGPDGVLRSVTIGPFDSVDQITSAIAAARASQ